MRKKTEGKTNKEKVTKEEIKDEDEEKWIEVEEKTYRGEGRDQG